MNRLLSCSLGLLALTAGCDSGKAPPSATTSASAARSAAPKGSSSGAAAKQHVGTSADYGFFSPVAVGEEITIYPMGESAIVDTGAFYAVLGPGPLEQDPELFRSSFEKEPGKVTITPTLRLGGFRGAYPDQAWATSEGGFMKLTNELWTKQDFLRENEKLLDLAPWEKKRAVAAIRMAQADIRFTLVGSASGGVVPAPGKPTATQEGCAVRMDPDAPVKLAGLPSGHLFAIGKECKTGKLVAERWAPNKARGDVDVLEGVAGTPVAIAAAGPEEAYAFFADGDKGWVATWDGKAWKGAKSPTGAPKSAWVATDGDTWALGDVGLYQKPKGGAWEEIQIGASKATSAWAKDRSTVWIVADKKTLVRSGPKSRRPLKLAPASEVNASLDRDKRWPATEACKRVYVQLAAIGPADKAPASFPALNDVAKSSAEFTIREISYVAEDVGGTLYAGAKVPSLALANRLVAAWRAKNASSTPLVFCHEPKLVKGTLKVE